MQGQALSIVTPKKYKEGNPEMEMTRDALLEGLCYVQAKMQDMDRILQQRLRLEQTLQSQKAYTEIREHRTEIKTEQTTVKGTLALAVIAGTLLLFFTILNLLVGGGVDVLSFVILLVCYAVLIADRDSKTKRRIVAVVVMVLFAFNGLTPFFRVTPGIFELIVLGVAVVLSVVITRAVVRFVNQKTVQGNKDADIHNQQHMQQVDRQNAHIRQENQRILTECGQLQARYEEVLQDLWNYSSAWYPPDYYTLACVDFFINDVRNYKSSTVQEMVKNLDESQFRQQVLATQQQQSVQLNQIIYGQAQIGRQLRTLNMLQAMSMIQSSIQAANMNQTIQSSTSSIINAVHTRSRR